MAETRDLLFRFLGDAKDLGRASRDAQGDLEGVNRKASAAVGPFGAAKGAALGFIGALGVGTVASFVNETARMGEQAAIAGESAEKVLGPALEGLHERFEDVRGTLGLNIGEFDTIAAKFGLLTDSMGLSDEAQAEFIGNLIETGGELAAFRGNVSEAPEAIDAMGAALRGEFDPLEQFGVKLSEAAVQERILELKSKPANAALSEQELRVKAIQELIDEKAAAAVGSLAEAADTLAGKTNEANTALDDARIALGAKLQGPMTAVLEFLLESIEAWERLANPETFETTQLAKWLRDLDEGLGPVDEWIGELIASFGELFRIVGDVIDRIANLGDTPVPVAGGGTRRVPSPQPYRPPGRPGGVLQGLGTQSLGPYGGSMGAVYITVNALDPAAAAKAVVQALQNFERTNGAIPITTRQP